MSEETGDMSVVEEALARLAVLEDVGEADLTAAVLPAAARGVGVIRARASGVASGLGVARRTFSVVDPAVETQARIDSGAAFRAGDVLLTARGSVRSLLTAERAALNFLQHLSGVATLTARFVEAVQGTGVRITDTRKTVPGLRLLEKDAVLHGGGVNHRLGLYDAVMIKDNHIDASGGIAAAVRAARGASPSVPIVVEARDLAEAEEAAMQGVGRILLDNMTPERITACVLAIRAIERDLVAPADPSRYIAGSWRAGDGAIQIEVSGGIRLENVREYALPGVDLLAVGAITHSAPAIDLTMDLETGAE